MTNRLPLKAANNQKRPRKEVVEESKANFFDGIDYSKIGNDWR